MTEVELALLCDRNLADVESEVLDDAGCVDPAHQAGKRHANGAAPAQPASRQRRASADRGRGPQSDTGS